MKKSLLGVATVLAAGVLGTQAWAGGKSTTYVYVDTATFRTAYGSMGDARNSTDTTQHIGCVVTAYGTAGGISAQCYAQDATGRYASCTTTNSSYITAVSAITPNALIEFDWDSSGACTYLRIYTSSVYRPPL
jgi:aldehyde:ferredoxin oxidoreductase